MENSDYQKYIIKKVEEFGGLDRFVDSLKDVEPLFNPEYKHQVQEVIIFIKMMHLMDNVDVRTVAIENEVRLKTGFNEFMRIYSKTGNKVSGVMTEIITDHLNIIPHRYRLKAV